MREGSKFGEYQIIKHLASGGMAEIYLARSAHPNGGNPLVALKVVHADKAEDQALVDMLQDEARIVHTFNHPNICKVFNFGQIEDNHYIAMEYINGKDLHQILTRCSDLKLSMPFDLITFITCEAAKGLYSAHIQCDASGQPLNIIHRDVSPQNILISYNGDVKIIDFGIAKANQRTTDETECGVLKGKFNYMSPEQTWSSSDIDARSDIFSLGICLYEMICGEMLFNEEKILMLLDMIRKAEIPSIRKRRKDVPDQLEQIALKALARERDDRYPTADAMQLALSKFLHSQWPDFTPNRLKAFMAQIFSDQANPGKAKQGKSASSAQHEPQALLQSGFEEDEDEGDRTVLASDFMSPNFETAGESTLAVEPEMLESGLEWEEMEPRSHGDEDATSLVNPGLYPDASKFESPSASLTQEELPVPPELTPAVGINAHPQAIPLTLKKTVPLRPQAVLQATQQASNSPPSEVAFYPPPIESAAQRPSGPASWQQNSPTNLQGLPPATLLSSFNAIPSVAPVDVYATNTNGRATLQQALPLYPQRRNRLLKNVIPALVILVVVALGIYVLTHQAAPNLPSSNQNQPLYVSLTTSPDGAQIWLNGQPQLAPNGNPLITPLLLLVAQQGIATELRFEHQGYQPYEMTFIPDSANAQPDAEGKLIQALNTIQLTPLPGKLRILSNPPGAEIELTNYREIYGKTTPFEQTLERKNSTVILKLNGYETQKRDIIWGDQTELEVNVTLPERRPLTPAGKRNHRRRR